MSPYSRSLQRLAKCRNDASALLPANQAAWERLLHGPARRAARRCAACARDRACTSLPWGIPKIMMTAAKPTMLSDMECSLILQLRVCCRIKLRGDWEGSSDILRKKIRVSRGRMLNDATTDQTFESHLLRPDLFLRLALGNYCGAKAGAEVLREFVELRIPVDLDGLLGSVA